MVKTILTYIIAFILLVLINFVAFTIYNSAMEQYNKTQIKKSQIIERTYEI